MYNTKREGGGVCPDLLMSYKNFVFVYPALPPRHKGVHEVEGRDGGFDFNS